MKVLETPLGLAVVQAIGQGLDDHCLRKKRKREGKDFPVLLPGGRGRTDPAVVYLLIIASGTIGNSFGERGYGLAAASNGLHPGLACFGLCRVPGRSTCDELVSAVTEKTLLLFTQAELMIAKQEGLDDFKCVIGDWSATKADSAKPHDARLFAHFAHC